MFRRIYEQWDISNTDAPTSLINRIIEKLVSDRQPPMSRLKRPMKIKFASVIQQYRIQDFKLKGQKWAFHLQYIVYLI